MRKPLRLRRLVVLVSLGLLITGCASTPDRSVDDRAAAEFRAVMNALAEAWNDGDARRAADCFTEDAVYSEPPDKQLYRGREALYRFFGGDAGRAGQMVMQWHHLAWDEESQIGFGEFSFTYGSTVHGVAVVRLRDGKIANWREYWYESELPWDQFIRATPSDGFRCPLDAPARIP